MNLLATHFKRTRARTLKKLQSRFFFPFLSYVIYILKKSYLLASGKNLTQPSFRGDFHLIFSTSEARWTCITHCTRARVYLNIIDMRFSIKCFGHVLFYYTLFYLYSDANRDLFLLLDCGLFRLILIRTAIFKKDLISRTEPSKN